MGRVLQRFFQLVMSGAILAGGLSAPAAAQDQTRLVGVAGIDITPDYPVLLTGYASRKTESEGITQRLWAKALAVGSDSEKPAILITVDNCGVPVNVRDAVVARLKSRRKIEPDPHRPRYVLTVYGVGYKCSEP